LLLLLLFQLNLFDPVTHLDIRRLGLLDLDLNPSPADYLGP
jgi:hypothetical protein